MKNLIKWLTQSSSVKRLVKDRLERGSADAKRVKVMFLGGPLHGAIRPVDPDMSVHVAGETTYRQEYIGFDGHEFVMVYVLEKMLISEALDLVLISVALRASCDEI
jgi:hypothetical protein